MNPFISTFFRSSSFSKPRAERRSTWRHSWLVLALLAGSAVACSDDSDDGGDGKASDDCEALCDRNLDCPMDPDRDECVSTCEALVDTCPDEGEALLKCTLKRSDSDYECDESGETSLKAGLCETETNELIACVAGGGDDTDDSTEDETGDGNATSDDETDETDDSGTSTDTDDTGASTDTDDTPSEPAENDDYAERCQATCSELAVLNCDQSASECEAECVAAAEIAVGLDCAAALNASVECTLADVSDNMECDEDGSPAPKEGVCEEEQLQLFSCLLGGGLDDEELEAATTACAAHCENDSPPVECAAPPPCQEVCVAFFVYYGANCGQLYIDYSACTGEGDASQWTCDEDGAPVYGGAECDDVGSEFLACIQDS